MKTETQIAEENVELFNKIRNSFHEIKCGLHKETCQRFLEFLDQGVFIYDGLLNRGNKGLIISLKNKITDLKQAIKLYEENGI